MTFFAMSYRVLSHDTMAYGSHHHTTNINFQNIARETLLFSGRYREEGYLEQLAHTVMLTRDSHSYNLAPVNLGEKVAILMSCEEPSRSTIRLCFRTLHQNGSPVSCGYQTLVFIDPKTYAPIPAPGLLMQYSEPSNPVCLLESTSSMSFRDKVHAGGKYIKEIFNDRIVEIGRCIANASGIESTPRFIDLDLNEHMFNEENSNNNNAFSGFSRKCALVMPGQGCFCPKILSALYKLERDKRWLFEEADALAKKYFNRSFLQVILATEEQQTEEYANFPEADQIGIYLTNYLIGAQWIAKGIEPDVLIGHSFGEYAVLALAGVVSPQQGMKIVCQRVDALKAVQIKGKMLAIASDADTLREHLSSSGLNSLELSVINHSKQCVVSGFELEIEQFKQAMAQRGIATSLVSSRFPFHSSHLTDAVSIFRKDLDTYTFSPPKIPIYSSTENKLLDTLETLPQELANQFIRTLDFSKVGPYLMQAGFTQVLESGAGNIVTRILQKQMQHSDIKFETPATTTQQLESWLGAASPLIQSPIPSPPKRKSKNEESEKTTPPEPVAIVARGCYLPGARRISLPTYPSARGKYWIDHQQDVLGAASNEVKVTDSIQWNFLPASQSKPGDDRIQFNVDEKIELFLRQIVAVQTRKTIEQISRKRSFFELGLSSFGAITLVRELETIVRQELSPSLVIDYISIAELVSYLNKHFSSEFAAINVTKNKVKTNQPQISPELKTQLQPEVKHFKSIGTEKTNQHQIDPILIQILEDLENGMYSPEEAKLLIENM